MCLQSTKEKKNEKNAAVVLSILLVLTMIGSVAAGGPADLKVNVRNSSGGTVNLHLTDANGNNHFLTIEPEVAPITLAEGSYSYYASLPCGNLAGTWNINVTKTLFLSCKNEVAFVSLKKTINGCQYFGTWDDEFQNYLDGDSSIISPDFYFGPGVLDDGFPMLCLDPYMATLMSIEDWQLRYVDENGDATVIDEYPNN